MEFVGHNMGKILPYMYNLPGLPRGEGRPGTHCEISRHSSNSNTESIRECHGITGMS